MGSRGGEDRAKMTVRGDPTADEDAFRCEALCRGKCGASEIFDHRILEAGYEVQGFRIEVGQDFGEHFRI